jgi:hypothetical protein
MKQSKFKVAISDIKRLKGKERNWFVAGFVDGEGSFNISFAREPHQKTGFLINPKFQVYQHKDHEEILHIIKNEVFHTGRIDSKWGTDVRVLTIENRKTLTEKVIPFFRKYFLVTKREVFEIFIEAIKRMERKEHRTLDGFLNMIDLVYDMNQHGKARKIPKEQIKKEVKNNFSHFKNPQRLYAGR